MKKGKYFVLISMILFLIGCSFLQSSSKNSLIPTEEPIVLPEAENETWQIRIEDIGVKRGVTELKCTDCDRYAQNSSLDIFGDYELFFIKANVINKTSESQTLKVFLNKISINPGPISDAYYLDDYQSTNLVALKLNEKMFIDNGIAAYDFARSIEFPPNVQGGEEVEFYFLIVDGDKVEEFYFEDLPAINLRGL